MPRCSENLHGEKELNQVRIVPFVKLGMNFDLILEGFFVFGKEAFERKGGILFIALIFVSFYRKVSKLKRGPLTLYDGKLCCPG